VCDGVSDQVRDQLSYSRSVAIDRNVHRILLRDLSPGRGQTKFIDDLVQDRFKRRSGIPIKGNASSQPTTREIKHVVNQSSHAHNGALKHRHDLVLPVGLRVSP
jgi:hypothetical protein